MNWKQLLFSTEGRIPRKTFWLGILFITIAGVPALIAAAFLGGATAAGIVNLLFLWFGFALSAKRAQDRNRHYLIVAAYFALAVAVSGLAPNTAMTMMDTGAMNQTALGLASIVLLGYVIYLFVELGCLRGTVGPNKYGPDPLEPAAGAQNAAIAN